MTGRADPCSTVEAWAELRVSAGGAEHRAGRVDLAEYLREGAAEVEYREQSGLRVAHEFDEVWERAYELGHINASNRALHQVTKIGRYYEQPDDDSSALGALMELTESIRQVRDGDGARVRLGAAGVSCAAVWLTKYHLLGNDHLHDSVRIKPQSGWLRKPGCNSR